MAWAGTRSATAFRSRGRAAAEPGRGQPSVTSMRLGWYRRWSGRGQAGQAAAILAGLDSGERASPEMRTATASLRLAEGNPAGGGRCPRASPGRLGSPLNLNKLKYFNIKINNS